MISMVESICNAFIWSTNKQKGSKPRIAWKKVCVPKAYGGLNICNLKIWNEVVLLKSLWALAYKNDKLWIKWVHDYYLKGADIMQYRMPSTASWMLCRIIDSRTQVLDWNALSSFVSIGKFNVQKAYLLRVTSGPKPPWRALWCSGKASPRGSICMWQILQNRLPTKDKLAHWGIQCDSICVLCKQGDESRDHLFGCCPYFKDLSQHIKSFAPGFFCPSYFDDAVTVMSRMRKRKKSKASMYVMLWVEMLYQTWLQRNFRVFGDPGISALHVAYKMIIVRAGLLCSSLFCCFLFLFLLL